MVYLNNSLQIVTNAWQRELAYINRNDYEEKLDEKGSNIKESNGRDEIEYEISSAWSSEI